MEIKCLYPNYSHVVEIRDEIYARDARFPRQRLFLEMPPLQFSLADCFQQQKQKNGIAFFVPVFFGGNISSYQKQKHPFFQMHGYFKRAFWMAHEFFEFTDLRETNANFFICVQEEYRDLIEPYRQLCEFPEENLISIPGLTKLKGYLPKIGAFRHLARVVNYQYYLSFDAAMGFLKPSTFCKEVETYWSQNTDHIIFSEDPFAHPDDVPIDLNVPSCVRANFATASIESTNFYTKMPEYFGLHHYESLMEKVMRPAIRCQGSVIGIPRSHLRSEDFEHFFRYVEEHQCLGNDESFLSFYWHLSIAPDRNPYACPDTLTKKDINIDFMNPNKDFLYYHVRKRLPSDAEYYNSYLTYYNNLCERLNKCSA